MRLNIFTVYDTKAEAYLPPFYMNTKGQAIRAFSDSANDRNHAFCKHPGDYVLFHLGSFDDADASFELDAAPQSVGVAIEFKTQTEMEMDSSLKLVDKKVDMRGGVS